MIDNAHNLSFELLQFILELADIRYNNSLFRFVLFSNESINESFEEPRIKELANGILQNIQLPSFTQVQTLAYIEFCISSCGDEDVTDHLFSDDEI